MMKKYNRIGIIIIVIALCTGVWGWKFVLAKDSTESEVSFDKTVEVTELDLGDYADSMAVGEKQLLSVTALPLDATDAQLTYSSSNTAVATVNGLGRITAISAGSTTITAACGKVSASFTLTVTESASNKVNVTDLDLGDYSKVMKKGETQVLSVTPLPLNATENTVTYASSNTKVATINSMGRITALKVGKTTITVSCDGITKSLAIQVKKKTADEIPVKKIEIADHEKSLEVDKTLTLTATVLPSDATKSNVTYRSSNSSVATVSSTGEVKGIRKGKVTIYVTAGKVTKKIPLKVIVATQVIALNNEYLVLKPSETYQLRAEVTPAEAEQAVTYQSGDSSVASVTGNGLVTAKKTGSTSILVSNGDYSISVSVIVNQTSKETANAGTAKEKKKIIKTYDKIIDSSKASKIDSEFLQELYQNKEVLKIIGNGYVIEIDGKEIVNFNNEFYTDISLVQKEQEIYFTLNQGKLLCGAVTLYLDESQGKYLYLKNPAKDRYQLVKSGDLSVLRLTTGGEYQITNKKRHTRMAYIKYIVIVGILISFVGVVINIVTKKKYWFW